MKVFILHLYYTKNTFADTCRTEGVYDTLELARSQKKWYENKAQDMEGAWAYAEITPFEMNNGIER